MFDEVTSRHRAARALRSETRQAKKMRDADGGGIDDTGAEEKGERQANRERRRGPPLGKNRKEHRVFH